MFCPECKCEYREGFSHCADCDVPLVEDLGAAAGQASEQPATARASGPMIDYCGFFTIDEARLARDQLRLRGVRPEIAIREHPASDLRAPAKEEFWIRCGRSDLAIAASVLGYEEGAEAESDPVPAEPFECPECLHLVPAAESFCPGCGFRFESKG